ncbi:hypothetical protein C8R44DRAFT_736643 [Mycena epipterygia]|nr:hypothetical protein C8R44DRAFT_736643 [Mycena epipterygia]
MDRKKHAARNRMRMRFWMWIGCGYGYGYGYGNYSLQVELNKPLKKQSSPTLPAKYQNYPEYNPVRRALRRAMLIWRLGLRTIGRGWLDSNGWLVEFKWSAGWIQMVGWLVDVHNWAGLDTDGQLAPAQKSPNHCQWQVPMEQYTTYVFWDRKKHAARNRMRMRVRVGSTRLVAMVAL